MLWGVYFGVLLVLEKLFLLKGLERAPRAVGHVYALFFIILGWALFGLEDMGACGRYLAAMFGLSGAPLLGLFVGLFNIIPYFGPFLGGVPAVITALSVGWQKAALTVLILFLVQQIDGMLISPRVMGSITGFSPAVVMISLFVGARVSSIAGMLLAMPALMAARTLYRVFVQRHENN